MVWYLWARERDKATGSASGVKLRAFWARSALVGQQRLWQREQEELDDAGEHMRRRPCRW